MSEMETVGAVAEAPLSTAEIASQVIESSQEPTDTGSGGYEDSTQTAEAAPAQAVTLSAEDQEIQALLEAHGFKDTRKPDGREHYIPRSKVLKMIGSGLKRGQEKWGTERGVFESQVQELTGHIEAMRAAVNGDPRQFLEELSGINPAFRSFLTPQEAAAAAATSAMPGPDVTLEDGSKTYSLDGLKALLEWNTAQVESRLLPKVDERLKPLTEREQRAQREAEAHGRLSTQMQEAQTWPRFGTIDPKGQLTPFQAEVLAELQQDSARAKAEKRRPMMTLRQAYLEVDARHNAPDKVREKVIAELNTAHRLPPAMGRQATDAGRPGKPMSTADIARKVVREAGA